MEFDPNGAQQARRKTTQAALPESLQAEARLTIKQMSALTGMGRTKIYAEIKAARLPEPERRGSRCSRWRAGDVLAALNGGTA